MDKLFHKILCFTIWVSRQAEYTSKNLYQTKIKEN